MHPDEGDLEQEEVSANGGIICFNSPCVPFVIGSISNCAPLVIGFSALTGINSPCVSLPSAKRAVGSITVLVVQLPLVSCSLYSYHR